nr:hypothetical protein [Bacillota bacterium]
MLKIEAVTLDLGNKLWEGHQVILPKIGSLDRRQKMREYQPPELIEHEIEKTSRLFLGPRRKSGHHFDLC